MDAIDIAGIVWIIFNYLILCPLMIVSAYHFCHLNPDESLQKYRSKALNCCLNIMMLLTLLIERPYANAVIVWNFIQINVNFVYYLVFSISWWSAFFLFFVKVFYLYYKQKYNMAVADLTWKIQLNPNENCNWYIMNQHKYGNPIFMVKITMIPFSICVLTNTLISHFYGEGLILDFAQYFIASIPIIASFIIFYKSRIVNDIYGIRNEILYQCIIIIFALSLYLGIFLYFKLDKKWINNQNGIRIEWLLRNLVANLCAIGLAFIPTAYPNYLYYSQSTQKHLSDIVAHNSSQTSDNHDGGFGVETQTMIMLKKTISEYDTFKAFMAHLISEFSTESLLFLIEYIQLKNQYLSSNQCILYKDGVILTKLKIPKDIPKSIILNKGTLKEKLQILYKKYIQLGSDHELNISGTNRKNLKKIFENNENKESIENMDDNDLLHCMDIAAMQILLLLQDPYTRFNNNYCLS